MLDGLPKGTRSRVFARIVDQLKTDPVLRRVVRHWNVWDGSPARPSTTSNSVEIQLTPRNGAVGWYSPDSQFGPLQVQVDLWLPGNVNGSFNAADALDLQEALESALYPASKEKRQAFKRELQCLGAETGEIQFSQPAQVQSAGEGGFVNIGLFQLSVIRRLEKKDF